MGTFLSGLHPSLVALALDAQTWLLFQEKVLREAKARYAMQVFTWPSASGVTLDVLVEHSYVRDLKTFYALTHYLSLQKRGTVRH